MQHLHILYFVSIFWLKTLPHSQTQYIGLSHLSLYFIHLAKPFPIFLSLEGKNTAILVPHFTFMPDSSFRCMGFDLIGVSESLSLPEFTLIIKHIYAFLTHIGGLLNRHE